MVVSAAVVGTVGAIGSSVIGSSAAKSAAGKQAASQNAATQAQKDMFAQTQANTKPFIESGEAANSLLQQQLPSLTSPVVMNQAQLQQTPGYNFNLTQGLKATQNAAAARGLGVSGAALKGAASYATGLADSTYQNQFNNAVTNKQNAYNFLSDATKIGSNAAAGLGSTSANVGSNISNTITGAGNAQAAGILGSANAISGGINAGANGLQNAFYANKILSGNNDNNGLYQDTGSMVGGYQGQDNYNSFFGE